MEDCPAPIRRSLTLTTGTVQPEAKQLRHGTESVRSGVLAPSDVSWAPTLQGDSLRCRLRSMTDQHADVTPIVEELLRSPAIADLQHLVRVEPFARRDGSVDTGWSCREHAVVVGALLTAMGVKSQVVHGANMFVVGPGLSGEAPYGVGNAPAQARFGHSWLVVEGFGALDLSPRLNERFLKGPLQAWDPISAPWGWVGHEWIVGSEPAALVVVGSREEYEREMSLSTHRVGQCTAIYWPQAVQPFSVDMLDHEFTDSPLRGRVASSNFEGALLKLAVHLWGLNRGNRRSLSRISQTKAWTFVGQLDESLVEEFTRLLSNQRC